MDLPAGTKKGKTTSKEKGEEKNIVISIKPYFPDNRGIPHFANTIADAMLEAAKANQEMR